MFAPPALKSSATYRSAAIFCFPMMMFATLISGCSDQPEIETYKTPKPADVLADNNVERPAPNAPAVAMPPSRPANASAAPAAGEKVRMLAAIVPQGPQAWFYKITGPEQVVASQVDAVQEFVSSVQYTDGQPTWTLPEGWEQQPGNQFRFATLMIPTDTEPLEMSVSGLPGSGDETKLVTDNINRWRGQVGLEPIGPEAVTDAGADISAETSRKKVADTTIYFVNLAGTQQNTGMRPPFAR